VLYVLSVAAIVASVDLVVGAVYGLWIGKATQNVYLVSTGVTLAVIALGTVEILAHLSIGKGELAALLAGRPINRGSGRDDERRLINIVDEMSIASGLAAPPLYVLNRERGINAFAAGASPAQAIVVVTQGAIEQLSRDELQAVIAHEFSHIINGDIRINLRAVYVLQGIVFLAAIGRFMMQYYSGAGTDEGRRFFHLPLAAIGVGVFAIGSIGLLFCRIIQAALARERENLADACAVQYTRNADALCGALARIRANADGSRVLNWHADALAHMLFAPSARGWLRAFFSTHPSIEERMRRINPHVRPEFYFEKASKPREEEKIKVAEEKKPEKPKTIVPRRATGVAAMIATIGAPDAAHLDYAAALLAYLPPSIREALGQPEGAQAVMLGLILDAELTGRTAQLRALAALAPETLARKAEVLAAPLRELDRAYRLPLVALAIPVLKGLEEKARADFLTWLRAAIQADRRFTVSEFVLETLLEWNLGAAAKRAGGVRHKARAELAAEVALVLSLLAHTGGGAVQAAFDKGREALAMPELGLAPLADLQLARVAEAFGRLAALAPAEKEALLEGFGAAVAADEDVKLMEHELLRAVACVFDCPMPPALAALDPRLLRK
jgi:Zn-dependent protease with chaperone function